MRARSHTATHQLGAAAQRKDRGRCEVAAGQVLALGLAQLLRGLREVQDVVHHLAAVRAGRAGSLEVSGAVRLAAGRRQLAGEAPTLPSTDN